MGVDVDVDDVDDNIIPGCYAFNIDVEGLELSKIWIRADYIRVYNSLDSLRDVTTASIFQRIGAILTGEPGIGEFPLSLHQTSTNYVQREERLVCYALRRRLAGRKPVVWYLLQSCYLFFEKGIYEAPPGFKSSSLHWTPMRPARAFHPILFRTIRAFSSYTPPLHARNGCRVCIRPSVILLSS